MEKFVCCPKGKLFICVSAVALVEFCSGGWRRSVHDGVDHDDLAKDGAGRKMLVMDGVGRISGQMVANKQMINKTESG